MAVDESKASQEQLANRARAAVNNAIRAGKIKRQDVCMVCGQSNDERAEEFDRYVQKYGLWALGFVPKKFLMVGHHYRGYEYPLDVWWVCQPCNSNLRGCHDGTVTLAQARLAHMYQIGAFLHQWYFETAVHDIAQSALLPTVWV